MKSATTVVRDEQNEIIGYVHNGGCGNARCRKAIREGRTLHAISSRIRGTLRDNHFATMDEAVAALKAVR